MQRWRGLVLGILLASVVLACGESERAELMRDKYPTYPDNVKQAIHEGKVIAGMNRDQVYLAIGVTPCVMARGQANVSLETWMFLLDKETHKPIATKDCLKADYFVHFENGRVSDLDTR